ncbi:MAG: hypothetical protein U0531_08700 [Dehalococcoidia bacterium]
MELGALVCTPAPRCPSCPLVRLCAAAPHIRAVREREGATARHGPRSPQERFEHSNRFYHRGRIGRPPRRRQRSD